MPMWLTDDLRCSQDFELYVVVSGNMATRMVGRVTSALFACHRRLRRSVFHTAWFSLRGILVLSLTTGMTSTTMICHVICGCSTIVKQVHCNVVICLCKMKPLNDPYCGALWSSSKMVGKSDKAWAMPHNVRCFPCYSIPQVTSHPSMAVLLPSFISLV